MTTRRRTTRALLALLVVCGLVLAGCSDSDDGDDTSSTTPGTEAGSSGDADPNGIFRTTYNLIQTGGSAGFQFDPNLETGDTNDNMYYLVYGRILRPTPEGDLVPDQAERTSIPDANTIEITLRPGQTFHDGTPLTAAAVKYSLERAKASGSTGYGAGFQDLQTVVTEGDLDLTLTIAGGKAASWHDQYLSSWKTSVVPEGSTFDLPVGAGPFEVTAWNKQNTLSLKAFDGYWDREAIKVAGIEFLNFDQGQEASAMASLQSGQVDMTQIDVPQLASIGGSIKSLVVADPSRLVNSQICKTDGPLANADARKAINKAVDRDAISAAVYEDTAEPGTTLWPVGHRFFDPELEDVLAYDPAAAKQLLTDAGYPNGFTFDMYVLPALGLPDVAVIIKQQLAEVGITMNIVPTPGIVNDFMATGKPGMSLIPQMTAGQGKLTLLVGDTTGNVCDYNNPELNSLAEQLEGVSESSPEAVELWNEIQAIIVNDALSGLWVFGSRLAAYDEDVVGDPVLYPLGTFPVPDFRITYVKAG